MSKLTSFFHHHANFLQNDLAPLLALLTSMIPMNPRDRENVDAAVQKVHEAADVARKIAAEGEQLAGVVESVVHTPAPEETQSVYADPAAQSSNTTTQTVLTGGGAVGG